VRNYSIFIKWTSKTRTIFIIYPVKIIFPANCQIFEIKITSSVCAFTYSSRVCILITYIVSCKIHLSLSVACRHNFLCFSRETSSRIHCKNNNNSNNNNNIISFLLDGVKKKKQKNIFIN